MTLAVDMTSVADKTHDRQGRQPLYRNRSLQRGRPCAFVDLEADTIDRFEQSAIRIEIGSASASTDLPPLQTLRLAFTARRLRFCRSLKRRCCASRF